MIILSVVFFAVSVYSAWDAWGIMTSAQRTRAIVMAVLAFAFVCFFLWVSERSELVDELSGSRPSS